MSQVFSASVFFAFLTGFESREIFVLFIGLLLDGVLDSSDSSIVGPVGRVDSKSSLIVTHEIIHFDHTSTSGTNDPKVLRPRLRILSSPSVVFGVRRDSKAK